MWPCAAQLDPVGVEEMLIFSFAELPEAQVGYCWVGVDRTPSHSWPATWIVVASVFGDPFFVDTSRGGCPLLLARHGAGSWSPGAVASSMESFIVAAVARSTPDITLRHRCVAAP